MTRAIHSTRRATLTGLAAAAAAGALAPPGRAAGLPRAVQRHPAFRPWKQMMDPDPVPLEVGVSTIEGRTVRLGEWLGKGPTVLVLWAQWCAPCMSEKPAQAALQRRLSYLRSSTRIKCVLAYDATPLERARATLDRLRCKDLETARATPEFEKAFVEFFGPAVTDPRRTTLPSLALLAPGGVELGRAKGTLLTPGGQTYWGDAVTMQFLAGLDRLLAEG